MTDTIRKKHLADTAFRPLNRDALTSSLTVADVDELFKELDEARGLLEEIDEYYVLNQEHYGRLEQILKGGGGMSNDSEKCSAATPSGNLLRDLIDPRIAKSEMEWCASREIARLTKENGKLKEETLKREKRLEQIVKEQRDTIVLFEKSLAACRKELDEARDVLEKMVLWHGGIHGQDCPEDDTCDCQGKPINDRINKFLKGEPGNEQVNR